MSDSEHTAGNATREEIMSALFANMVMQQTNITLMLLGKVPHPETGKAVREIDGARMYIDQLEMIEFKTRGNLAPEEEKLLKQSLTAVRMAFVEAIDQESDTSAPGSGAEPAKATETENTPASGQISPDTTEERRKKFSKSY